MSAYNALKHFIRAEAELFVSEFAAMDEPIGIRTSGAIVSLTWAGQDIVTVAAALPQEGTIGTVSVYRSGAFPHEYTYLRAVRYPFDIRKVAEQAVAEARAVFWRGVDTTSPF